LHMLNGCLHGFQRVDTLEAAAEVHAERISHQSGRLSVQIPACLDMRKVAVRLAGAKVLNEINLAIPIPGIIGIVGGSGAGKSTLVHAVLGLVRLSAGTITLGMHDLATASLCDWRRTIGYVPQETILFHASIRENLTIAKPDATDAEIKLAAKRGHALDFINALPQGFDTVIGDQGVKLSGGQRQRLGIARALLRSPNLLLMDEAMSALDVKSETEVLSAIEELRREIGILIITHRLSSLRAADTIYVIEAGRIIESGSWSELMAVRSHLRELVDTQLLVGDRPLVAAHNET